MTRPSPVVHIHPDADTAGVAAASQVASALSAAVARTGRAVALFASAPSQTGMLAHLRTLDVPWQRIDVFHLDEYIGLDRHDERGFAAWLRQNLLDHVPAAHGHFLASDASDPDAEGCRYARLLDSRTIDVAAIGIGVNGHIAFNEPFDWELSAGPSVRRVRLQEQSRIQQVDEGLFPSLDDVPREALTLSVPCILRADRIVVTVLGSHKAAAVREALASEITPASPASALHAHPAVTMHLDDAASALLTAAEVAR